MASARVSVEHDGLDRLAGGTERRDQCVPGHAGEETILTGQVNPIRAGMPGEVNDGRLDVAQRTQQVKRPGRHARHELELVALGRALDLLLDCAGFLIKLERRGPGWIRGQKQDLFFHPRHLRSSIAPARVEWRSQEIRGPSTFAPANVPDRQAEIARL
jgi:hypothetical protein